MFKEVVDVVTYVWDIKNDKSCIYTMIQEMIF